MFISLMSYDCLYIKDIDMTYKYKYNLQKSFKYKYNLSNTNTSFTDSHYTLHLIISKSFKTIFHYWNIIIIHLCWKILYFKVYIDKYTKYRDSKILQMQIRSFRFNQIQIPISDLIKYRYAISYSFKYKYACICTCKYKCVFDPSPEWYLPR